jgi:hypothetical protein
MRMMKPAPALLSDPVIEKGERRILVKTLENEKDEASSSSPLRSCDKCGE